MGRATVDCNAAGARSPIVGIRCFDVLCVESEETRQKFDTAFGHEIQRACLEIDKLWDEIFNEIKPVEERQAYVRTLFLSGSNFLFASCQTFRLGLFSSSVGLLRPAWESFFTALLCSTKQLDVFERYKADRYSVNDSLRDVKKHYRRFKLDKTVLDQINTVQGKILNKNIHPAQLALAADYLMGEGAGVSLGGHFDPAKRQQYLWLINEVTKIANAGFQLLQISLASMAAR